MSRDLPDGCGAAGDRKKPSNQDDPFNEPPVVAKFRRMIRHVKMWDHTKTIGKKGGKKTAAKADELRDKVHDAALRYRRKHPPGPGKNRRLPDDPRRSQRDMARDIGKDLDVHWETVRGHLKELGLK